MSRREEDKIILTTEEPEEASVVGDKQQSAIVPEEDERISIVIHETAASRLQKSLILKIKFESLKEAQVDSKSTKALYMHRVPLMLHDTKHYNKCFEPRVVSVGPYHHGKNNQLMLAEPIKLQTVKRFIKNHKQNEEDLYYMIFEEIQSLKECYDDTLLKTYKDEELAWMLFVDGCCVLHYIVCYKESKFNELYIKDHEIAFVHQDLFLLENQLPYRVLELLMDKIFPEKGPEMMKCFIEKYLGSETGTGEEKKWSWWTSWSMFSSKTTSEGNDLEVTKNKPASLLELLRRAYVCKKDIDTPNNNKTNDWQSFRSVSELTVKGIHLTPSDSNRVTDVHFHQGFYAGQLKLPPITIDDSTKAKLLNLIALEMCLDRKSHDSEVTSYVCFLDALIDNPKDVRELRDAGILYNMLGADEEVSQMFNEITTDLVPNSDIYKRVKSDIQKHCKKKVYTWVAKGLHTHFDSPWTFLAFLAAVLALFFSGCQTYYSIKSASNKCDHFCKLLS